MPYYGQHLIGSEFNAKATDAEFRAAHNLWWAAWHQVPAASLPDNDSALARFADLGRDVRAFRRVKDAALHGFVKCSDGRLYHQFLAREAQKAWAEKQRYERKKERTKQRVQQWRNESCNALHNGDVRVTDSVTNGVRTPLTGQDTTGQDKTVHKRSKESQASRNAPIDAEFKEWYGQYPYKVEEPLALKAYRKARKVATADELMAGAMRYSAECEDPQYLKKPANWLNAHSWKNPPRPKTGVPNVQRSSDQSGPYFTMFDAFAKAARGPADEGGGG